MVYLYMQYDFMFRSKGRDLILQCICTDQCLYLHLLFILMIYLRQSCQLVKKIESYFFMSDLILVGGAFHSPISQYLACVQTHTACVSICTGRTKLVKSYSIHTLCKNSKVAFLHTYCQPTTLTTNFGPPPWFMHSGEVLSSHDFLFLFSSR